MYDPREWACRCNNRFRAKESLTKMQNKVNDSEMQKKKIQSCKETKLLIKLLKYDRAHKLN